MINTVIFDLGGVYFSNGTEEAIKKISSKYDIPPERVEYILKGSTGTKYRIGALTADRFWHKAKKYWNIDTSSKELSSIWFKSYKPIHEVVKIINRLKANGYELFFLSDNVQERVDYLEDKYHFLNNFKGGIFSYHVKTRKPNLKIYKLALKKSSHPVKECVYIDDELRFLEAAKRLGVKVILFTDPSQLESDLKKLGLKF